MEKIKDTFVGIIMGPDENTVSVGVIDARNQHIAARTFTLTQTPLTEYFSPPVGPLLMDDMIPIDQFLASNIADPKTVRVLIEVDDILGYPPSNPRICSIVQNDSILLKVIAALNYRKSIALMFNIYDQQPQKLVLLYEIPDEPQLANIRPYQPLYLRRQITKAYADFLLNESPSLDQTAVIAALIAKNKGAYLYWSSFGIVQSSKDIIGYLEQQLRLRQIEYSPLDMNDLDEIYGTDANDLSMQTGRQGYESPTSVISASEIYTMYTSTETSFEKIDKIPLKYASFAQKYKHLGPNDSIKAGFIQVCKLWNITLTCTQLTAKAVDPVFKGEKKNILVYPISTFDSWIIDVLHSEDFRG